MTTAMIYATSGAMGPQELRRRTQESEAREMRIRRAIAAARRGSPGAGVSC